VNTRRIGTLEVSVVGLGCNNFGRRVDQAGTTAVVDAALDAGITFFDTADIYGDTRSEEFLGRALGARRDEVVVATKFGIPYEGAAGGGSAAAVREACAASLRRLGTDRIDLYQMHFPDNKVPIAETLAALDELVRHGMVREIGCSNFSVDQLREAAASVGDGAVRFTSVQNQYNLFQRDPEAGVLDECARTSTAFLPYSPLANGVLTGKYRTGEPPPAGTRLGEMAADQAATQLAEGRLAQVAALGALAAESGHEVVDLAVAWLLSHAPVASVIAGATRPEQVRANAAGAGWELGPDVLGRIGEIVPAPR
jgi:aryl-alcohol dehydrogenase-like predicted oxidoreductase